MTHISLTIQDKTYNATLYDNLTTQQLSTLLPLTITMNELHGNEKYHTLDTTLPTNAEAVRTIKTGDFMLYGDDTLVLFYQDFSTPYTYTKLGKLNDTTNLENLLGHGNVTITISKSE